jgi:asparagine synthetase B (glutamine-hydrolysing)
MCATIIHRGPEEEGIYAEGGVGLGMRRLGIVDVAGGQQPVHERGQDGLDRLQRGNFCGVGYGSADNVEVA